MQSRARPRDLTMTRRTALQSLALIGAGLAAGGCTPLRMGLKIYPKDLDLRPGRVDRILRAFSAAVVPGVRTDDPTASRVFYDEFYPLARHRKFLAADLCERATRVVGTSQFEVLSLEHRERVVKHGLEEGGLIARLYHGAVFLTQIAILAGIYDDETGCPMIEFEGRYRLRRLSDTTYPAPERYLTHSLTADGNPA